MENTLLNAERLTNWLRKQDPTEEYVWSDPVYCMMGKYLYDNGSNRGAAQGRRTRTSALTGALRGDRRREALDVWRCAGAGREAGAAASSATDRGTQDAGASDRRRGVTPDDRLCVYSRRVLELAPLSSTRRFYFVQGS